MSISQEISLSKTVFGTNGARDFLDEEFTEFIVKKYTISEFLQEYHNLFYDIPKEGRLSHSTIVTKSTEYAGIPINPKDLTIEELKEQATDIQEEIDSIEKEHPLINNRSVLQVKNDVSMKYYMQSGKRRKINEMGILDAIKNQSGFANNISDDDFCISLNAEAIYSIEAGPDINTEEDINLDILFVNRFTPGVDYVDPLSGIKTPTSNPDLKTDPFISETSEYNPLMNIEDPEPTPEGILNQPDITNLNPPQPLGVKTQNNYWSDHASSYWSQFL